MSQPDVERARAFGPWTSRFSEADLCAYVGPRPQSVRDGHTMLIGRDSDLTRIANCIVDKPLVILHGASGVGKSSLVMNGLIGNLGNVGFDVLLARQWSSEDEFDGLDSNAGSLSGPDSVEKYLMSLLYRTHTDKDLPVRIPEGIDLIGQGSEPISTLLDRRYDEDGRYAVVVLDQFEELLRKDRDSAARLVQWAVGVGYRHTFHVVISLRTDSVHLLDPLLRGRGRPDDPDGFSPGVKPFSLERVELEAIEDETEVTRIIRTVKDPPGAFVDDALVEGLVAAWRALVAVGRVPSLLELQATLYTLYFKAPGIRGGSRVLDGDALGSFLEQVPAGTSPFAFGLQEAVALKLDHLEEASRSHGIDAFLIEGTMEMVRRTAPLLSSGGFKVPINEREVASRVLSREREGLKQALTREVEPSVWTSSHALSTSFLEILLVSEDVLATQVPDEVAEWSPGTHEATAGPMMGRSAASALFEELRRVVFAMKWLESGGLVRREPDGTLLLVHDGAGPALVSWAEERGGTEARGGTAAWARRQLVAANGETYDWGGTSADSSWAFDGASVDADGHEVIANLSWRNCRLTGRFRNVVFVNCDFTGSLFIECEFRGVTFVNCLLDDANFEDCVLSGSARPEAIAIRDGRSDEAEANRLAPSFVVATPATEVNHFRPYLSGTVGVHGGVFFSDTSGLPASLSLPSDDFPGRILANLIPLGLSGDGLPSNIPSVRPAMGGITVIGGRVCFLTLYRCTSSDGSAFALHHVSGDGVDLVEPSNGFFAIHDGAIRGISISRDGVQEDGQHASIEVEIDDSLIQNIYFADGLAGSAVIRGSAVFMLINAGDNGSFPVDVLDCRYQFIVNARSLSGAPDSHRPEPVRQFGPADSVGGSFELPNRRELANDLEKMDYRASPAAWEARQRERRRA